MEELKIFVFGNENFPHKNINDLYFCSIARDGISCQMYFQPAQDSSLQLHQEVVLIQLAERLAMLDFELLD